MKSKTRAGKKMADQHDMKELIVEALKPIIEDISSLPDKECINNVV